MLHFRVIDAAGNITIKLQESGAKTASVFVDVNKHLRLYFHRVAQANVTFERRIHLSACKTSTSRLDVVLEEGVRYRKCTMLQLDDLFTHHIPAFLGLISNP